MRFPVNRYPQISITPYNIARIQVQTGDLLFCSGNAMFSKLIKKVTKSKWSHVGLILRLDTIDRVLLLESVESQGVRAVPLSYYSYNYNATGKPYPGRVYVGRHVRFNKKVSTNQLKTMTQFAVDHFGYPYDRNEVVRIATRIGMELLGLNAKDVERDKEYICSEYVWECLNKVGILIKYGRKGFIAPVHFARDPNITVISRLV